MMPDDETATGYAYDLIPAKAADARFVRFKVTPERTLTISEVQALEEIRSKPFDLRIALPEEKR